MSQLEFLDRVKRIAIVAMFSDDRLMNELVLKGGNALEIAHDAAPRASLDLDFSMGDEFEPLGAFRQRVTNCLSATFAAHGWTTFDIDLCEVPPGLTDDVRDFWGGYRVEFKLVASEEFRQRTGDADALRRTARVLGAGGSTKFRIDISKHEFREGKVSILLDDYVVYVYSPAMIVCEKLRAICQQMPEYAPVVKRSGRPGSARAKDFVDIHAACETLEVSFSAEHFSSLLRNVFAAKRVPLDLLRQVHRYREFHRPDFVAVRDTVKAGVELKEFDFYFDFVLDRCRELRS